MDQQFRGNSRRSPGRRRRNSGRPRTRAPALLPVGASRFANRGDNTCILAGAGDDGHVGMILGGSTDECWAADIDILHRIGERATGSGNRRLEGVQVDNDEVDWLEALLLDSGQVFGYVSAGEDSTVDLGVQSLTRPPSTLG